VNNSRETDRIQGVRDEATASKKMDIEVEKDQEKG
jgi:hypothetical protein